MLICSKGCCTASPSSPPAQEVTAGAQKVGTSCPQSPRAAALTCTTCSPRSVPRGPKGRTGAPDSRPSDAGSGPGSGRETAAWAPGARAQPHHWGAPPALVPNRPPHTIPGWPRHGAPLHGRTPPSTSGTPCRALASAPCPAGTGRCSVWMWGCPPPCQTQCSCHGERGDACQAQMRADLRQHRRSCRGHTREPSAQGGLSRKEGLGSPICGDSGFRGTAGPSLGPSR